MRSHLIKSHSRIILFIIFLCLCAGCGPKPEKVVPPQDAEVPLQPHPFPQDGKGASSEDERYQIDAPAIWFVTSNLTNGGTLGRLDLKTRKLNTRVLTVARDAILAPDGTSGLFLLSRMGNDSISILTGTEARVAGYYSLPEFSNPQFAARDSLGRIWVSSQHLNYVQVLNSTLSSEVGRVDLSKLAVESPSGSYASFGQIVAGDSNHMVVVAQRLHRGVGAWQPDPRSGLAVLNIQSLQPDYVGFLDLSNPTQIFVKNSEVIVVGDGDLSPIGGASAETIRFSLGHPENQVSTPFNFVVHDAHVFSLKEPPAWIAWYKGENRTCLQLGAQEVHCEKGSYVFNRVLRVGNFLYASYSHSRSAELWIVAIDHSEIRKVPVNLPIQSLAFGP